MEESCEHIVYQTQQANTNRNDLQPEEIQQCSSCSQYNSESSHQSSLRSIDSEVLYQISSPTNSLFSEDLETNCILNNANDNCDRIAISDHHGRYLYIREREMSNYIDYDDRSDEEPMHRYSFDTDLWESDVGELY